MALAFTAHTCPPQPIHEPRRTCWDYCAASAPNSLEVCALVSGAVGVGANGQADIVRAVQAIYLQRKHTRAAYLHACTQAHAHAHSTTRIHARTRTHLCDVTVMYAVQEFVPNATCSAHRLWCVHVPSDGCTYKLLQVCQPLMLPQQQPQTKLQAAQQT